MDTPRSDEPQLTEDETRVLEFLAWGGSSKEIAAGLRISPETVRRRVQSILRKLGVHSRLEAVAYALRRLDGFALRWPDPPPLPPAAAAALAVPFQRAEEVPRHVGRPMPRKPKTS